MAIPIHGVRQIRTLSGIKRSSAQGSDRHVHQFRLAALELECSRLVNEKRAAEKRIRGILARITEIRHKMQEHREVLDRDPTASEAPSLRRTPRVLRY
ncbi:MAG: hypothetical protein AAGF11_23300 [Myxococcota bacterium]